MDENPYPPGTLAATGWELGRARGELAGAVLRTPAGVTFVRSMVALDRAARRGGVTLARARRWVFDGR